MQRKNQALEKERLKKNIGMQHLYISSVGNIQDRRGYAGGGIPEAIVNIRIVHFTIRRATTDSIGVCFSPLLIQLKKKRLFFLIPY